MSLSMDSEMPFGKYKGKQVEDILEDDAQYLKWLAENTETAFDSEILEKIERI